MNIGGNLRVSARGGDSSAEVGLATTSPGVEEGTETWEGLNTSVEEAESSKSAAYLLGVTNILDLFLTTLKDDDEDKFRLVSVLLPSMFSIYIIITMTFKEQLTLKVRHG